MSLPNLKVDTISFQPISTFPVPTPFVTVPSIPTFANPSIPTFSFPSSLPSGSSAHDDKTMHCALGGASAFLTLVISFVTLAALQKRKKASESSMRPLATSVPLRAPHAEIVEVQAVERPRDLEQAQEVEQPRQPPPTLFYYAPNWGVLDKDIPPVQLYLDHFEALYPDLISFIASASDSTISTGRHALLVSVEFWPFKLTEQPFSIPGPTGIGITTVGDKCYAFSKAAELFGRLEDAGWSRRVLYTFLRDKVEQSEYELSVQDKEAFAAVMQKMCNHCFVPWLRNAWHWICDLSTEWIFCRLKGWDSHLPSEIRIVYVDMNSVEWILEGGNAHLPGIHLVPDKPKTLSSMERLVQSLPIWGKVEDFNANFRDCWQIMVNSHQGL